MYRYIRILVTNWCFLYNSKMERAMAWFVHCSTLLCLKMRFSWTAVHVSWTYTCILVFFTDNAKCRFAVAWYGFPLALSCSSPIFSEATSRKLFFIWNAEYEQTIATNGHLTFQYITDYWDACCSFPFCWLVTGFMQESF